MIRSAKPSPFTSPAEATDKPLLSPLATPSIRKPLLPFKLDRFEYGGMALLLPPGVVTTTLDLPVLPAGVVQVAVVLLVTLNVLQATPPTLMAVAPLRLVPVIVMDVPPKVIPLFGEMAVTEGAAKETVMFTVAVAAA